MVPQLRTGKHNYIILDGQKAFNNNQSYHFQNCDSNFEVKYSHFKSRYK